MEILVGLLVGLVGGVFGGAIVGLVIASALRARATDATGASRPHRPVPVLITGRWRLRLATDSAERDAEAGDGPGLVTLDRAAGLAGAGLIGNGLSGQMDHPAVLPGSGRGRLSATYADGILTALFDDGDPATVVRGALVVRLLAHGDRMRGHLVLSGGPGAPPRVLGCEMERIAGPGPATGIAAPRRDGADEEPALAGEEGDEQPAGTEMGTEQVTEQATSGARDAGDASQRSDTGERQASPARAVWRPAPGRGPDGDAMGPRGGGEPPRVIDRSRWPGGGAGGTAP